MELQRFTENNLVQMQNQLARLREKFAVVQDVAELVNRPGFPLPGISIEAAEGGEAFRISFGAIAVDLLLTYSRPQDGGLIGRITVMLVRHPLESEPVQLDWFSLDRQGKVDLTMPGQNEDGMTLDECSRWLVLTLVDRALTHLPGQA